MLTPCEVAAKSLLPPARAAIAKELMARHGFKQVEAAKLLGLIPWLKNVYPKKSSF